MTKLNEVNSSSLSSRSIHGHALTSGYITWLLHKTQTSKPHRFPDDDLQVVVVTTESSLIQKEYLRKIHKDLDLKYFLKLFMTSESFHSFVLFVQRVQ